MTFRINLLIASTALAVVAQSASAAAPQAAKPAAAAAQGNQVPTRTAMAQSIASTFKAIDTNNDGSLSSAELSAAETKIIGQRVAAIRSQFEDDFNKLDTNKDGNLSKAEFLAAAPSAPPGTPDASGALAKFDANKDGKITAQEFSSPQLAVFDKLDTNKDGTLSDAERQAAGGSR